MRISISIYVYLYLQIYISMYLSRGRLRFIMRNCSCNYERWEVPRSAVYKLKTQESQAGCIRQSNSEDLRTRRADGLNSSSGEGEMRCTSSTVRWRERESLFLPLFVLFRPSPDWMRPTTLGRVNCFTQFTVNIIWNTITGIPRIVFNPGAL